MNRKAASDIFPGQYFLFYISVRETILKVRTIMNVCHTGTDIYLTCRQESSKLDYSL